MSQDAVLNPKFSAWDVNAAAAKLEEDIKTLADNPQSLLLEVGILQTMRMVVNEHYENRKHSVWQLRKRSGWAVAMAGAGARTRLAAAASCVCSAVACYGCQA